MKKRAYTVNQLLELIPQGLLEQLEQETEVNYQVKKLTGERMFKLLLFGLTNRNGLSSRILETYFNSVKFKQFAQLPQELTTDHSSLAARLSTMDVDYFAKIYQALQAEVHKRFAVEKIGGYKLVRFDSTAISIAGSLLKQLTGIHQGISSRPRQAHDPVQLKVTTGFDGLTPRQVKFFNEQEYLSEDVAMAQVIWDSPPAEDEIAVFDRGLGKRKTLDDFTDHPMMFVTRLKTYHGKFRHKVVGQITPIDPEKPIETDTLLINQDLEIYLYDKTSKKTKHTYRLVVATSKQTKELIYFLSNEKKLAPELICQIYKRRWDIEVFFKFLKQEFGFTHLLSRNENGIQIMLYMTLITFTLIFLYYKLNSVTSFKIAKIQFAEEIELEVIKLIVEQCKGDPSLVNLMPSGRF